jgi:hypothetical protein
MSGSPSVVPVDEHLALRDEHVAFTAAHAALIATHVTLTAEHATLTGAHAAMVEERESLRERVLAASEPEVVQLAVAVAERVLGRKMRTELSTVVGWVRDGIASIGGPESVAFTVRLDVAESAPAEALSWTALSRLPTPVPTPPPIDSRGRGAKLAPTVPVITRSDVMVPDSVSESVFDEVTSAPEDAPSTWWSNAPPSSDSSIESRDQNSPEGRSDPTQHPPGPPPELLGERAGEGDPRRSEGATIMGKHSARSESFFSAPRDAPMEVTGALRPSREVMPEILAARSIEGEASVGSAVAVVTGPADGYQAPADRPPTPTEEPISRPSSVSTVAAHEPSAEVGTEGEPSSQRLSPEAIAKLYNSVRGSTDAEARFIEGLQSYSDYRSHQRIEPPAGEPHWLRIEGESVLYAVPGLRVAKEMVSGHRQEIDGLPDREGFIHEFELAAVPTYARERWEGLEGPSRVARLSKGRAQ